MIKISRQTILVVSIVAVALAIIYGFVSNTAFQSVLSIISGILGGSLITFKINIEKMYINGNQSNKMINIVFVLLLLIILVFVSLTYFKLLGNKVIKTPLTSLNEIDKSIHGDIINPDQSFIIGDNLYTLTNDPEYQLISVDLTKPSSLPNSTPLNRQTFGHIKKMIQLRSGSTGYILVQTEARIHIFDKDLKSINLSTHVFTGSTIYPVDDLMTFAAVYDTKIKIFKFDGSDINPTSSINLPQSVQLDQSKNVLFFDNSGTGYRFVITGLTKNDRCPIRMRIPNGTMAAWDDSIVRPISISTKNISIDKRTCLLDDNFKFDPNVIYYHNWFYCYDSTISFDNRSSLVTNQMVEKKTNYQSPIIHEPIDKDNLTYRDSVLFVSTTSGKISSYSCKNGLNQAFFKSGQKFINTIVDNNIVYASDEKGKIYKFQNSGGGSLSAGGTLELIEIYFVKEGHTRPIYITTSTYSNPNCPGIVAFTTTGKIFTVP